MTWELNMHKGSSYGRQDIRISGLFLFSAHLPVALQWLSMKRGVTEPLASAVSCTCIFCLKVLVSGLGSLQESPAHSEAFIKLKVKKVLKGWPLTRESKAGRNILCSSLLPGTPKSLLYSSMIVKHAFFFPLAVWWFPVLHSHSLRFLPKLPVHKCLLRRTIILTQKGTFWTFLRRHFPSLLIRNRLAHLSFCVFISQLPCPLGHQ